MSAIIGIDPGATGWIVAVDSDGIVWSAEMPEADGALTALLRDRAGLFVYVERQQPMPRDKRGVIGGFQSGFGFGRIMEAVAGLGMRHQLVRSQDWQRDMLRGDYDLPGWDVFEWSRDRLTYGGGGTKDEEAIWFSPTCLKPRRAQQGVLL